MWEKNKGIIECDKSTVIYDIVTTQYENSSINFERK